MIFSQTAGLLSGTMNGNSVEAVPPSLPLPSRSVFSPSNGFAPYWMIGYNCAPLISGRFST